MQLKQNVWLFDVMVVTLVAALAFGTVGFARSVSLVTPASTSSFQPPVLNSTVPVEQAIDEEAVRADIDALYQDRLQAILDEFALAEANDYGIVVRHLDTGLTATHQADTQFISASLYKPFAAVAALKLVDKGQLSLQAPLSQAGGRTVQECIVDTITVSDNPCGIALLFTTSLTVESGHLRLSQDGYRQTDLRSEYPVTTAGDVAALLEHIYRGEKLSEASNDFLLQQLKDQQINDRLPLGLPDDTVLAHKTGDLEGSAHDAGIVYSQTSGDYIISVLSGPDDSGRTLYARYERFGDLMSQVHELMIEYQAELDAALPSF